MSTSRKEGFQHFNFILVRPIWTSDLQSCGGGSLVAKLCLTLGTPWSVALQAPLSMGFPRCEYWSELPFPSLHTSTPPLKSCVTSLCPFSLLLSGTVIGVLGVELIHIVFRTPPTPHGWCFAQRAAVSSLPAQCTATAHTVLFIQPRE